jgi:hypothetical protein
MAVFDFVIADRTMLVIPHAFDQLKLLLIKLATIVGLPHSVLIYEFP